MTLANKKPISSLNKPALSIRCDPVSPKSQAAFHKLKVPHLFSLRCKRLLILKNAVVRSIWLQEVAPTILSIEQIWPCLKTSIDLRKKKISKALTSNSDRERVFQRWSGQLRVQQSRMSNTGSKFALTNCMSASWLVKPTRELRKNSNSMRFLLIKALSWQASA